MEMRNKRNVCLGLFCFVSSLLSHEFLSSLLLRIQSISFWLVGWFLVWFCVCACRIGLFARDYES